MVDMEAYARRRLFVLQRDSLLFRSEICIGRDWAELTTNIGEDKLADTPYGLSHFFNVFEKESL